MSATRLLVLGVVRIHGQAHGYRVGRELMDWGAEEWANVKWGSLYHALRKLSEQGRLREFVAEGEVTDRTSYEITEEGEAEYDRLLRRALSSTDDHAMLCAGITLMTSLPRADVIGLLRERLEWLEGNVAGVRESMDPSETKWGKPAHVRELYRLWEYSLDSGAAWTRRLISSLEAGEYVMADDSPSAFGLPPA
ncbi:PadR family transcriptional regulator [Nocardiopsis alba]|uniref:PadR family transcriptional regulator n=1 Tax=Nocardiopsis TaxID=2013 RepID=UPI002DBA7F4F|nr:PadR family transcriptional regulator [Nocardiopsis sp. LDBS1602]MEC3892691.1 PadR family transcriptional regulator [Nocardiopsis sp. LDBS1602]